jgi:outer membrane protein OmpA-like peptidoglycan-associated protein
MTILKFFALVGIFSASLHPLPTVAASNQLTDSYPNYVVIGAFRYHRNAMRFTNHATRDLQLNAKYQMNQNRKLYYVYVLSTPDRTEAIAEARRLRSSSEFRDTWVYCGELGKGSDGKTPGIDINPETTGAMEQVVIEPSMPSGNTSASTSASSVNIPSDPRPNDSSTPDSPAVNSQSVDSQLSAGSSEPDSEIEGKKFFFLLSRAIDKEKVDGDVDVIDLDKIRKIGTYKGNMDVKVSKPSGASGKVSLVCEVFGYRKVQRELDYSAPAGDDITTNEEGVVSIPFELTRLQKGDIAIMYNVYFFKDAAVMRPESRYEVNSLLEMLKENPKYKIKIHGHANGKASGRIVMLEEGNTNPFSLTRTKDGYGSAKKLSEERANVIKSFLVNNDVDASRMQVKAWGGKKPIHDKHSTRAQENVRVEIEILED